MGSECPKYKDNAPKVRQVVEDLPKLESTDNDEEDENVRKISFSTMDFLHQETPSTRVFPSVKCAAINVKTTLSMQIPIQLIEQSHTLKAVDTCADFFLGNKQRTLTRMLSRQLLLPPWIEH